jgi:hypothetical protein
MNYFPAVDPIPLPAPVLLFKILHILTLALHFIAVEMLLGGLALALILNMAGRGKGEAAVVRTKASGELASRLPVVMTYVINLGVPPLLFVQVLYGRAIYTSSVLIGVYWIAIVFLLIGAYWHLYKFTARVASGKSGWPAALVSMVLVLAVSKILTTNMTLMLRPDVWPQMYSQSAGGVLLPPSDPTLLPRWSFMLAGGLAVGGLWMMWLAGKKTIESNVRSFFAALGGKIAVVMLLIQIGAAFWVFSTQPAAVQKGLSANAWYNSAMWSWIGCAIALAGVAAWSASAKSTSTKPGWLALTLGLVGMLAMTLCRDGIRDVTLGQFGYDVWNRSISANWQVVGLFLVVFVGGLASVGWLVSVVMRAKPVVEKV